MNRLWRTSAIQLSLRYAVLYMVIAGGGLWILYWATSSYVDTQIATGLRNNLETLKDVYDLKGSSGLIEALQTRPAGESENRRFTLMLSIDGRKLAGDLRAWPDAAMPDEIVRNIWVEDSLFPDSIEDHDGYWPSIGTRFADGSRLLITQSISQAEDLQEFILIALLLTLALIIGLTLLLGWRMGRQLLERIDQINHTAGGILDGRLDRRIPLTGRGDEFDELAENLNSMLDHIDRLIEGMRQVTDNVAHDLRRPLTRLRNRLDVTLLEPRDPAEYRQSLEGIRSDIDDVIKTFNAVLEIAQAESGHFRGEMTLVDLSGLLFEIDELYQDIFEQSGQSLNLFADADLHVWGNRQLLAQVLSNLLENAHKYAGDGARVEIRLQRVGTSIELTVCDNGPGIPTDQRDVVLNRFVRLDTARSATGNGLGLSLVAAISHLHNAALRLDDNAPGLCVQLKFPSPPAAAKNDSR